MSGLVLAEADIKAIAAEIIAEQKRVQIEDADDLALRTVATILTSFGIEENDRKELQADFIHLRKWRKSVESAGSLTTKVILTAIVSGLAGAVWLGVKALLGK